MDYADYINELEKEYRYVLSSYDINMIKVLQNENPLSPSIIFKPSYFEKGFFNQFEVSLRRRGINRVYYIQASTGDWEMYNIPEDDFHFYAFSINDVHDGGINPLTFCRIELYLNKLRYDESRVKSILLV